MMKQYLPVITIVFLMLFQGCSRAELEEQREASDEILLSSLTGQSASGIRAVGNFPNDGSIGLFASTTYDPTGVTPTDWRAYDYINNAKATASSVNNNIYSFTWEDTKYWPFDGGELYFVAYSPYAAGNDNNYILSTNEPSLFIGVHQNMPDILYASNNLSPQAYNKENPTVELGEFTHILSQLTVQVIAQESMASTIRLSNLTVSSKVPRATFNFVVGESSLRLDTVPDNPVVIPFVTSPIDFRNPQASFSQFLFPGTQEYTEVSIGLVDINTGSTFDRSYMMSYFQNDNGSDPVRLERGKNTILRFLVSGVGVDDPNLNISLTGEITDWNDQGRYGVTIE